MEGESMNYDKHRKLFKLKRIKNMKAKELQDIRARLKYNIYKGHVFNDNDANVITQELINRGVKLL